MEGARRDPSVVAALSLYNRDLRNGSAPPKNSPETSTSKNNAPRKVSIMTNQNAQKVISKSKALCAWISRSWMFIFLFHHLSYTTIFFKSFHGDTVTFLSWHCQPCQGPLKSRILSFFIRLLILQTMSRLDLDQYLFVNSMCKIFSSKYWIRYSKMNSIIKFI